MKIILFCIFYLSLIHQVIGQDLITISVDFGGESSEFPWNNLTNSQSGSAMDLRNQLGQETQISIEVTDAFNGTNTNGTVNPDTALGFPAMATGDSFFGNAVEFSNTVEVTGGVTISGLDKEKAYALQIFASREATDNRETQYTITGMTSDIQFLNASSNRTESIELSEVYPAANGSITITATTGPNNDNSFGFFYLGALKLSYEDELVVLDSLLVLNDPQGDEYWQMGKAPRIKWTSQSIEKVLLEYSTDDGATWLSIGDVPAYAQAYTWMVPDVDSENCLIRISSGDLTDISEANFTMNSTDTTACHIVVLGSSTAAGTGPTSVDSAWVWMYEDFIFQRDTRFNVTNLARGGFTTYNILPDETVVPDNPSFVIDIERNVTKALSLNPDAIIINLPSNDAANSVLVSDQIYNYEIILADLKSQEIPYWICTPQPRNGFNVAQQMIQNEMLDSTLTIYADSYIDFWTELATDDNVNVAYNSGDGVHLNNAGHKILLQRVLDIEIDSILLDTKAGTSSTQSLALKYLELYPNPTSNFVTIDNLIGPLEYKIFDKDGRQISSGYSDNNRIELNQVGLQFIRIKSDDQTYFAKVIKQ